MEIESIIADLTRFSDAELFYRHCYELGPDIKALKEYIAGSDQDAAVKRRIVTTTATDSKRKNERFIYRFSSFGVENVALIRHLRYAPPIEHCHDFFEIVFVFRGKCENVIEGKRIALSAGSLCFIAPQIYHFIEVFDDDSIVINILIRKTTFDEVFIRLLKIDDVLTEFFLGNIYGIKAKTIENIIFNIGGDTEMMESFYAMLVEQSRNDKYSSHIMENFVSIFLSLLIRNHGNKPLFRHTGDDTNRYLYIAYIDEHFRTITLTQMARHFSVSTAHFSRLLKAQTGKRFTDLVADIRLRHAQSLLSSTNMKILDISYSLGYKNQETFIRGYKKRFGITPGQYRQNFSQNHTSKVVNKID